MMPIAKVLRGGGAKTRAAASLFNSLSLSPTTPILEMMSAIFVTGKTLLERLFVVLGMSTLGP